MGKKTEKQKKGSNDSVLEQLKKLAQEQKKKVAKKESKKRSRSIEQQKSSRPSMTPMTKEDYEKKRSIITSQYDPETGRIRRVRATGEILESIVTREQHLQINKMATLNDGISFSSKALSKAHHRG